MNNFVFVVILYSPSFVIGSTVYLYPICCMDAMDTLIAACGISSAPDSKVKNLFTSIVVNKLLFVFYNNFVGFDKIFLGVNHSKLNNRWNLINYYAG